MEKSSFSNMVNNPSPRTHPYITRLVPSSSSGASAAAQTKVALRAPGRLSVTRKVPSARSCQSKKSPTERASGGRLGDGRRGASSRLGEGEAEVCSTGGRGTASLDPRQPIDCSFFLRAHEKTLSAQTCTRPRQTPVPPPHLIGNRLLRARTCGDGCTGGGAGARSSFAFGRPARGRPAAGR